MLFGKKRFVRSVAAISAIASLFIVTGCNALKRDKKESKPTKISQHFYYEDLFFQGYRAWDGKTQNKVSDYYKGEGKGKPPEIFVDYTFGETECAENILVVTQGSKTEIDEEKKRTKRYFPIALQDNNIRIDARGSWNANHIHEYEISGTGVSWYRRNPRGTLYTNESGEVKYHKDHRYMEPIEHFPRFVGDVQHKVTKELELLFSECKEYNSGQEARARLLKKYGVNEIVTENGKN